MYLQIRYGSVDLRVSPEKMAVVEEVLTQHAISHVVFIADLQTRVQESRKWLASPKRYRWQENLVGQYIYICLYLQNVNRHTDIFRNRGADFSDKFYSNLLDKREIKLIKLSERIIDKEGSIIFKNHIFTILKWHTYKVANENSQNKLLFSHCYEY